VRFDGTELSYGQLDEAANRLAHHLRAAGVAPGDLVGVFLERGVDLVVAILAVLKSGAAYVPMDPAYPAERVRFMARDAAIRVLVTSEDLARPGPEGVGEGGPDEGGGPGIESAVPVVVRLDTDRDEIGRRPAEPPPAAVGPDHPAYVIYTSGSTGKPKGVVVSHRNAVRLFEATRAWFEIGETDVWTLFHSAAFDFSVWELWGALGHGGTLVVVPFWVSRSPDAFWELLVREGVTVLSQTPSAFRQLARGPALSPDAEEPKLRYVVFGGEALELQSLRPWLDRWGDETPRLVNMYGITETTVHVTYRRIGRQDLARPASVVGRAIPDLSLQVLDRSLRPAPCGVAGELCVGGAGLAWGYLRRGGLTARRFVPDPFAALAGARLYRSGDSGRFRAGGDVEYLGRIDQQVKVRGFRIELGEIESALAEHPAVAEAVAVVRRGATGEARLVGYVVPAEAGTALDPAAVQSRLRETLPEYMVPPVLVALERLPTTPSGKVDRQALPAPPAARAGGAPEGLEAPRPGVEETLSELWREILAVDAIDRRDNFFELGGDSILLLQVVTRAREKGVEITPRQVFQHQTIAEIAAVVGRGAAPPVEDEATGPLPPTPIQHWFWERRVPDPHHFNLALALAVAPGWDGLQMARAVAALVEHHDVLRLRARRDGPGAWQQEIPPPEAGESPFTQVDLERLDATARTRERERIAEWCQRSLHLEHGPVFRAVLSTGPRDEEALLLLVAHHLVIDGVSWRILAEDLDLLYDRRLAGEEPRLPGRTASYLSWSRGLSERAMSGGQPGRGAGLPRPGDHPCPAPGRARDLPQPDRRGIAGRVRPRRHRLDRRPGDPGGPGGARARGCRLRPRPVANGRLVHGHPSAPARSGAGA
jgi:amino acid adenylation domain-containing protein